jgi:hypothetical protein
VLAENEATFSKVTDDIPNTARIPQVRKLMPEEIQVTCQVAYEKILG